MDNLGQNKFCPNCGSQIEPGQIFCPYCGKSVAITQQPFEAQPQQNVNPYADQQQNVNPYADQQQNVNPYSDQQQNVNTYADQQPEQIFNPYANQQTLNQNANTFGQQSIDPYSSAQPEYGLNNGTTISQSSFAEPKKRSKKPFIIACSAVLGVVAVAVAGVLIFNALRSSAGPITRIAEGVKNLAKADSMTITADMSYDDQSIEFDGSYEIDREKREVVAVFNGKMDVDSLSTQDQDMKIVIYCKGGIRGILHSNYDGWGTGYVEISQENLDKFFDALENKDEPDWNNLDINNEIEDHIYTDKIEEVSNALIEALESNEGKEALGLEESSADGGTKYSFNLQPYAAAKIAVDAIEPLFKDKTEYNEMKSGLSDAESTLNSLNIRFDISLDKEGNFSGLDINSFGIKADVKLTNINNTKVNISSSEIDEIKNFMTDSENDYSNYDDPYLDDYTDDYTDHHTDDHTDDYTDHHTDDHLYEYSYDLESLPVNNSYHHHYHNDSYNYCHN